MGIPKLLYKYRSWEEDIEKEEEKYQKRLLTNQEFYFSSPFQFNDPFDLAIPKRFDLMTKDQFFRVALFTLGHHDKYKEKTFNELSQIAYQKTQEKYGNNIEEELQKSINHFCSTHGVFSLSESPINILSWTFYANNHAGFCLGIETKKLMEFLYTELNEKASLMKVHYTDTFPSIIPDMDVHMKLENIFIRLTTKYIDWSYEKEWRVIAPENAKKCLTLPKEIIHSIYLGHLTKKSIKEEIINILKEEYNRKVRLYEAKADKTDYKMTTKEVAY